MAQPDAEAAPDLSAAPRLGPVDLRVTDPERLAAFWADAVGLPVLAGAGPLTLGFPGRPLIRLHAGATGPMPEMALGLFHIALQVPTDADLARTAARLAAAGCRHTGQDHLLSRSLYVADPDGNKIEITHLTPGRGSITVSAEGRVRGETTEGQPHSILEPLDPAGLRATLPQDGTGPGSLPEGTINGHIHFRSRDLAAGFDFYGRILGLMPNLFAPATQFCDLGRPDHPHLVALNMWAGARLVSPPEGAAGMIACTLHLPAPKAAAARLRADGFAVTADGAALVCADPDGNRLRLVAADAPAGA